MLVSTVDHDHFATTCIIATGAMHRGCEKKVGEQTMSCMFDDVVTMYISISMS